MTRRLLANILCLILMTGTARAESAPEDHWAKVDVTNCVQLGLLQEHDSDWYNQPVEPNQFYKMLETTLGIQIANKTNKPEITRFEMAETLAAILTPDDKTAPAFKICEDHGIIKNYPDGNMRPDEIVTNAQACAVTIRMIKSLCEYIPEIPNTGKHLANGEPIVYKNVWSIIQAFKAKYPTGTLWAWSDTVGTEYYHDAPETSDPTRDISAMNANMPNTQTHTPTSLKYGCGGFSCQLSDTLFGQTGFPCHEIFDTAQALPGDIVYFVNDNGYVYHIATVYRLYRINGEIWFQTAAANEYDQVRFSDDIEKDFCQINKTCRVFTRYPSA